MSNRTNRCDVAQGCRVFSVDYRWYWDCRCGEQSAIGWYDRVSALVDHAEHVKARRKADDDR